MFNNDNNMVKTTSFLNRTKEKQQEIVIDTKKYVRSPAALPENLKPESTGEPSLFGKILAWLKKFSSQDLSKMDTLPPL